MQRRCRGFGLLCGAIALLVAFGAPRDASPADPFYEGMLAEGREALARGELESALLELEIASFGLLDEPVLLADALTHLALAQAEAGLVRPLDTTLERMIEVETRFGGYRQAEIPPATRQRFEELLANRIALARLEQIETFRPLAQQRELETLMAMRPGERRSLLEGRIELDPEDFRALQLLAELELEEGRPRAALGYLDRLIELGGEDPILICRRFRAAARAGECAVALPDLEACAEVAREPAIAEPILDCLATGDDPAAALEFIDTLPPQVRRTSKIRKTERRLERRQKELDRLARARPPAEETTPSDPTLSETAAGETAAGEGTGSGTAAGVEPVEATGGPESEEASSTERPRADSAESALGDSANAVVDPCVVLRRDALAKRCDAALERLPACRATAEEPVVAERLAKCMAQADRWRDLLDFVDSLPPQVAGRPKLRKLARRAGKRAPEPAVSEDESSLEATDAAVATRTPQSGAAASGVPSEEHRATSAEHPEPSSRAGSEPDPETLADARRQLAQARSADDLDRALRSAVQLARRFPESSGAQLLAAEAAYRAALWEEAIHFFEAAGDPGADRPLLLFYFAVSLYEVGRADAALPYLERSLPKLRRTPFVQTYAERIRRAAAQ